jgi:hypothetical protein
MDVAFFADGFEIWLYESGRRGCFLQIGWRLVGNLLFRFDGARYLSKVVPFKEL